jgi:glucosamine-6-phosphate deaminase
VTQGATDTFSVDALQVRIYDETEQMGQAAADFAAAKLKGAIQDKGEANLILATGASQFAFLDAFKADDSIEWDKITVFHLDEYIGIDESHKASFRKYLKERILNEVQPKQIHLLNGDVDDIDAEVTRYENLLKSVRVDVACIGIGENGHIAFNDPPVADFDDPHLVKVVELDEQSRKQQVGEGWFDTMDDVPKEALSLTIPAMMRCGAISCVVPDERKADAVYRTVNDDISTECPATILRKHPDTVLFLDAGSASQL